jgi:hypothetical protein
MAAAAAEEEEEEEEEATAAAAGWVAAGYSLDTSRCCADSP